MTRSHRNWGWFLNFGNFGGLRQFWQFFVPPWQVLPFRLRRLRAIPRDHGRSSSLAYSAYSVFQRCRVGFLNFGNFGDYGNCNFFIIRVDLSRLAVDSRPDLS